MLFSIKVIHDTMITVSCCVRMLLLDRLFFSYSFCSIGCGYIYICSRFVWISFLPSMGKTHSPSEQNTNKIFSMESISRCLRARNKHILDAFGNWLWYDLIHKKYTQSPHPPQKRERKRYQPYFGCHLMMTSSCSQQHQDAEITAAINIANYTIKWP